MILGDGRSSRLYRSVVYETKSAKSTGSFVWDNELGGLFIVYATGFKNTNLDSLEKGITDIIAGIGNEKVTETELEKAKNSVENDIINSMQTVLGKADALANYWTYFKDTNRINRAADDYLSVTKEDILKAAKKYLRKDNRVVLYYEPKPAK